MSVRTIATQKPTTGPPQRKSQLQWGLGGLRILAGEADDPPLEGFADRDPDVVEEKPDEEVEDRRRQDDGQDGEKALEKEALHESDLILRPGAAGA